MGNARTEGVMREGSCESRAYSIELGMHAGELTNSTLSGIGIKTISQHSHFVCTVGNAGGLPRTS